MRIATSTAYESQYVQIDNLYAQYQQQSNELSTGKSLNYPSDDPTVIAQDLAVRADGKVQTQVGSNLTNLNNELSAVDGSLSTLTSILQSARPCDRRRERFDHLGTAAANRNAGRSALAGDGRSGEHAVQRQVRVLRDRRTGERPARAGFG
jgi:hypothetical protein